MDAKSKSESETACVCPFCKLLEAYKGSEAATHVRAIRHEVFALGRCILTGCLRTARDHLGSVPPKS